MIKKLTVFSCPLRISFNNDIKLMEFIKADRKLLLQYKDQST